MKSSEWTKLKPGDLLWYRSWLQPEGQLTVFVEIPIPSRMPKPDPDEESARLIKVVSQKTGEVFVGDLLWFERAE